MEIVPTKISLELINQAIKKIITLNLASKKNENKDLIVMAIMNFG